LPASGRTLYIQGMLELFTQLDWPAFLLAMFIVELTPGPNMGWLAAVSAQQGRKVGTVAVAGITLGLAVQMIAAATGVSTLIAHYPMVYQVIRWAGVAFMIYLAWEAFADTGFESAGAGDLTSAGFTRGFIANILNPKALVFYVAVVGQFADPDLGQLWWQILILGSLHLAVAVTVHMGIVLLGAKLGDTLERRRTSLPARIGFSLALLLIAAWIAMST